MAAVSVVPSQPLQEDEVPTIGLLSVWEDHSCPEHSVPCFIKTGTSDGPQKGKSFHMCCMKGCKYAKSTTITAALCPAHKQLVAARKFFGDKVIYRCKASAEDSWCGSEAVRKHSKAPGPAQAGNEPKPTLEKVDAVGQLSQQMTDLSLTSIQRDIEQVTADLVSRRRFWFPCLFLGFLIF